MEKEYVVSIDVTEQVAEDHWISRTKTLKILPHTTVGEIEEWYRKIKPDGTLSILITELQTLNK